LPLNICNQGVKRFKIKQGTLTAEQQSTLYKPQKTNCRSQQLPVLINILIKSGRIFIPVFFNLFLINFSFKDPLDKIK